MGIEGDRMRKLPIWKKLVFGMVATVGLLGICELVLRIVGYHGAISDPFESFVLHLPLFEPDGDEMRTGRAGPVPSTSSASCGRSRRPSSASVRSGARRLTV
jgi:hypothetical protein